MLAMLRRRDFALLWLAGVVSRVGDWLLFVALPYHVYELTGSALATGAALSSYNVARVLFSPVAGIVVDRTDRRRLVILTNIAGAATVCPLLLVTTPERVWIAPVAVFVLACLAFMHVPADGALVAELVPAERLVAANALHGATFNAAALAGPVLGGAAVALWGFPAVVVGDALSFLAAAALVAAIRLRPTTARAGDEAARRSALEEWRAAAAVVRGSPRARAVFAVGWVVMVGYGALGVLTVVFVREVLGGGPPELGWVTTAAGVGGLAGTLAVASVAGAVPAGRLAATSLLGAGGCYALAFNGGSLPLAVAALGAAGACTALWTVGERTLVQRAVPGAFLGRTLGATATLSGLLILLGTGVGSAAADAVGVAPVLTAVAALYAAAGVLAALLLGRTGDADARAATGEAAGSPAPTR